MAAQSPSTRTARAQSFTMVGIIEWMRRELSWHITSWEDIGSIINGPLLFVAALVAGVNQVKGGAVLAALPWIGVTWAILQIVGIDMQYMACARRTKDATQAGRRIIAALWLLLALVLAVPVFVANVQFTLQLMLGWSDAQAMALLGITPLMIAVARAGLQALLAFISAITRETRPDAAPAAENVRTEIVLPPPDRPRGTKSTSQRTNSNAGVPMVNAMQKREQRIALVRSHLQQHPGQLMSVRQAAAIIGSNSMSTARSVLDEAVRRQQQAQKAG